MFWIFSVTFPLAVSAVSYCIKLWYDRSLSSTTPVCRRINRNNELEKASINFTSEPQQRDSKGNDENQSKANASLKLIAEQQRTNFERNDENESKSMWNKIKSVFGTTLPSFISMSVDLISTNQDLAQKFVVRLFGSVLICADVSNPVVKYLLSLIKPENKLLDRSSKHKYIIGYKAMLQYEIQEERSQLKKYKQNNVKLTFEKERIFHFPITEQMTELCNAIDENLLNQFILMPNIPKESCREIRGRVKQQQHENIYVEMCDWESFRLVDTTETYSMDFQVNSKNFDLQTNALQFIDQHDLFECLIQNPAYNLFGKLVTTVKIDYNLSPEDQRSVYVRQYQRFSPNQNCTPNHHLSSSIASTVLNAEQKTAVENIVNGNNYPLPYLLYGPPGTGKTKTLVAAIEHIVRTTNKKILVCAMSNAACDEITERLLSDLKISDVYRFYSVSYNLDRISSSIKRVCNISAENKLYYPSTLALYQYRVLICTLSTAGSLTNTRADSSVFRVNHFQYVIIDECASSHETMTLIPIAGLCSSLKKIHANIVLCGDPKQLPAVTKSKIAEASGFNISWMEHLLDSKLYKRCSTTGKYNQTYITQLIQNYRSHAAILKIPNDLFYDGQLKAKASENVTHRFINSNILPSKKFPIIFKSVQGFCQTSDSDTSKFNKKEIDAVITYIKKLLQPNGHQNPTVNQFDIGIVTPYKMQCKKIAQACRKCKWNDITIGTSEVFQGREKPVMIVSTVRAGGKYLGFVNDPRRMNVVITRAKCLLIIVGDPHTLRLDNNWATLIKYCLDNNGLIQSNKLFVM